VEWALLSVFNKTLLYKVRFLFTYFCTVRTARFYNEWKEEQRLIGWFAAHYRNVQDEKFILPTCRTARNKLLNIRPPHKESLSQTEPPFMKLSTPSAPYKPENGHIMGGKSRLIMLRSTEPRPQKGFHFRRSPLPPPPSKKEMEESGAFCKDDSLPSVYDPVCSLLQGQCALSMNSIASILNHAICIV
jgi:hypothetical protein